MSYVKRGAVRDVLRRLRDKPVAREELAEACRGVADKLETRCSNPQEHLWDCECDAEKPEGR